MTFKIATLFVIAFLAMEQCVGYPTGAPKGVCATMTPKHSSIASKNPELYAIDVKRTANPNEFSVQILHKTQIAFKGFLLKAINADTNGPVRLGEFHPHDQAKNLECQEPALTHHNTTLKYDPTFIFQASSPGRLMFNATVVNEYTDFYVGIQSNVIQI